MKRFPLRANTADVFRALFPEVRYSKKRIVGINDFAAAMDDPIFDHVEERYAQEMHCEGTTRLFTYDLNSPEDLIEAWTCLGDFRALNYQDRTLLIRESTQDYDTCYWVASLTSTEILTPWGNTTSPFPKGTFNAIWDAIHLLQPHPPPPIPPPNHYEGILIENLKGADYIHIPDPQWIG